MSTTSMPPQSSASQPRQPKPKKRHPIKWTGIAIIVILGAIAIYAAVHQGVRSINFKQGTISFQNVRPADIKNSQPLIRSDLSAAKGRAQAQAQSVSAPSVPNISGYWYSNSGLSYYINQYGNNAVVEEESSYGITAVGEGVVYDSQADFDFRAYNGSNGLAVFYFQSNGTIDATFENYTYGTTSNAVLTR
jgi:hypothetical protein